MNEPKRRGRPPKARVEGSASPKTERADAKIRRVMADVADKEVAAMDSNRLADIVATFKAEHEAEWELMRLCPLENGLEEMVRLLK